MRRLTALLATALCAAVVFPACGAGVAHRRHVPVKHYTGVSIPLDEVRLISFDRPISTLYIGNPVIADVTMIDKRHAFIQGKAFGATNIIALDASGRQISNRQVVVAGGGTALVTVQRGASQTTYACAGTRCENAPQPGDGKDTYDSAVDQISKHQAMITKVASGDAQ